MSSNKLTDDWDLYRRAFKVYCLHSNRLQVTNNLIHTKLRQVTNSINVTAGGVTRVLSIGPGDGEVEDEILKVIRDRNETVHPVKATIVEPSICMMEEYQNRVVTHETQLHDISYDWRTETLEAFLENGGNDGMKFHFISAMHSVYYFQDLPGTLRDLYNRLVPGGMMLIMAVTENTSTGVDFTKKGNPLSITSEKVKAACVTENIPIAQEFVTEEQIDITDCFKRSEDMTEDGRLLLDFFTNVMDFTKIASPETQEQVFGFLKSDFFTEKDGKIVIEGDYKSLIIIS